MSIKREKKTIELMLAVYCRRYHGSSRNLCGQCSELLSYAYARLDRCPHGDSKPSCRKCTIHCYSPDNRKKMREVMRYVGPRMLFIHPLAAIRHLIKELR